MTKLLREVAVAALVCGSLAACETTPHYPIDAADARGPAPLSAPRPHYPIDASQPAPGDVRDAAASGPAAPPPAAAPAEPDPAPLSAPVGQVESAPLPPPGPSAEADGARLQYASMRTESTSPAPAATTPATTTPPAAPVATATSAASPPAAPPPAPSPDPALTPRQVIHDQASAGPAPSPSPASYAQPAAHREYATLPPSAPAAANGLIVAGPVVSASGDIYENYEVQRGEHIDQLARNFSTTRDAILDANHIHAPYVIRPGQIIRVPVTKAYVARSGDTLLGVAKRFSVSPSELAQINHVELREPLRAGQEIGLPSSMRDRGPQRADSYEYAEATPSRSYSYAPPRSYTPHGYVTQVPTQPTMVPDAGYHAAPAQQPPTEAVPTLSDAQIQAAARGRFAWPVRGDIVRKFGPLGIGQRNDGVDIKAAQGTMVKAAAPGEVVYAGNAVPGFGNLVLIKHADGWVTAYAHLDSVSVAMKQEVTQGQVVGTVGASGGLTEPELHFEVRYAPTTQDKARPVDPVLVLPGT